MESIQITEKLLTALQDCIEVMNMQLGREKEELHIPGNEARHIYLETIKKNIEIATDIATEIGKKENHEVNHPTHYTSSENGIECIDAIQAALTPEEFRGFCKGNAIKYTWREKLKGGNIDLEKAQWYLRKLNENKTS